MDITGPLRSCYRVSRTGSRECIVQLLYDIEANGQQVVNEQDCPLLIGSSHLQSVPSTSILSPVSVVHECDSSCKLEMRRKRKIIERESVDATSLVLKHDFHNGLFALNIYCLNIVFK